MALRSRNSVGSIRGAIFCLSFGRLLWLSSLIVIIGAEKDRVQRGYNWQILAHFFDPALLMSDNIVMIARKLAAGEDCPSS